MTDLAPLPEPFVHPDAFVEEGVVVGPGCRIWSRAHLRRGARLGEECRVGVGAFIDVDVTVGARCKLENGAMLFAGARLEDDVFVGPLAVVTNDQRPRASTPDGVIKGPDDWTSTTTFVARGASLGAAAVLVAGCHVGEWALVGAGAVVTHPVPAHALVVGNPARFTAWLCRCAQRLTDELRCPACGRTYAAGAAGLRLETSPR